MRNILNVIVDILTLLAIAIAGVGHMLPWFNTNTFRPLPSISQLPDWKKELVQAFDRRQQEEEVRRQWGVELIEFQSWHALRSGISLAVLLTLVLLFLAFSWAPGPRRLLVLAMFASSLAAIIFITLAFTPYPLTDAHRRLAGEFRVDSGFFLALIPTCFACSFCLLRMLWTMPPVRPKPFEKSVSPQAIPVTLEPAPPGETKSV